jgi:hypothetical protein
MKAKKILMYLMITFFSAPFIALAQDAATTPAAPAEEEKTFTISGSIDTYAHTTFGKTNTDFGTYAPTTSFANLKGFGIGMANLIASYQGEKAGFTADLVFGPRGSDAVFNSGGYVNVAGAGSGQIVNQLFAYYKVSDAVTFNLGQFNTFLGYEVISPTLNFHYSTSYMFSNGPFSHTGFRVDFASEGGFVAKLAVMNPTDFLEFNPVNTVTFGGQVGYTSDGGGIWLNALYGDQDGKLDSDVDGDGDTSGGTLMQVDLTTGWNLGEAFYLGFNTSYQSIGDGETIVAGDVEDIGGDATSFFGAAVYPKVTLSESFALGARVEYFSSKKGHPLASPIGVDAAGDGNVIAATLSANYKVGGLTIIPEVRMDKTSEDSFAEKDGTASDMMISLTLAAVYKF